MCDSKSEREWRASGPGDSAPHCRFMVVYVSGNSPGDRERRSDSLAERPRFEPNLFLFFSSSPPHLFLRPHQLSPSPVTCSKLNPVEVNDKQTTQGGWGGESEEWVGGRMDGDRDAGREGCDTKESLSHSLRC